MKACISVIAGLAVLTLSSVSLNALAARANDVEYTYYSDATHTVEVGHTEYYCDNGSYTEGQVTAYKTTFTFSCSLGAPAISPPSDGQVYTHCTYATDPYPVWNCG